MANMCFYFVSGLFLHSVMACLAMTAKNLTTDQSALLAFKAHIISGPHSVLANNWSISNPVCNWVGISCGSRHSRVTALNLSDLGLAGTIPPQIGNLSFLVSLNLGGNHFHGQLPHELGRLRRLRVFNFNKNNLTGDFPTWIGMLSELRYLGLYNNSFTGTFSLSLFNLSKLEILWSSYNIIEGNIPSEIGKLSNLKELYLRNNQLTGPIPSTIYNISSLQVIDFDSNRVSGSLPNDMCNRLPKLEQLYLTSNGLSGQLPASLGDCSELQGLLLSSNNFSGHIPENIGNLTKLLSLLLDGNDLTGEIPQEIGNLQNLLYLNLDSNSLTGVIPQTIFNISTIVGINLIYNHLSGHLPSSIGQWLPNLKFLYLAENKLSGKIPNSISNASKLNILELSSNSFSGTVPNALGNLSLLQLLNVELNNLTSESPATELSFLSSLTNCRKLEILLFGDNPLYGILPPSIGNFSTSLQKFELNNCKLMGSIPIETGNLQSLIILDLSYNELNGSVPTTVGRLRNLQGLFLRNNNLQGSIPYELCQIKSLNELQLNDNKLSGHIPTCLASLTSLRDLHLGSNKFSFSIPASLWTLAYILHINLSSNSLSGSLPLDIQNLKVLIDLDLSRNQLSGDIPVTIGGLKDLVNLSLADNRFGGPIPKSFGSLISLESLDLSNNNLSGEIPKSLEALSYLRHFNVSHNKLEGEIPSKGAFKNFSAHSFMWNYALCGSPLLQVQPCSATTKQSNTIFMLVLKFILPPVMSTILVVIAIIIFTRYRDKSVKCPVQDDFLAVTTWRRTSYLEIQRATDGLCESNLLGVGSFGSVYKGILSDGINVAIKVFNLQQDRALRSFDSECEVLRNIRHRNLIKIVSSCCNDDFKALVLEFMPNGSLERWLYSHNYFLGILERLNIMIDVASALEYLHHGHSTPVIHCDLKPSNILLDENMVAHVSDFGISKLLGEGDSMTQTMTLATIGYMAPEYGSVGLVSPKGDVYSFGVVLMETFTRKKPTEDMFAGEMSLKQWVKDSLPHAVTEVMDANLLQEENAFTAKTDCVLSIMDLALDCCMESPEQRINMKDVVVKLKKIKMKFVNDTGAT